MCYKLALCYQLANTPLLASAPLVRAIWDAGDAAKYPLVTKMKTDVGSCMFVRGPINSLSQTMLSNLINTHPLSIKCQYATAKIAVRDAPIDAWEAAS